MRASLADYRVRALEPRDLPVLQSSMAEWIPADTVLAASDHRFRVLINLGEGRGALAGIAEYQQILDEGHLLGIAIDPAMQRRGLGMFLLMAVLDEMRTQGCVRCLLEVRSSNVAAQALYERAQFTRDGMRKNYYPSPAAGEREHALLYSRML